MASSIRQIKEWLTIDGEYRTPDLREDGKHVYWDNSLGKFAYADDNYVVTAARESGTNRAELTLVDGSKVYLALGALAWSDATVEEPPVTSVFGRLGDIVATAGDYTASQVTNAFDVSTDTLDDITAGITNVHFTTLYRNDVDANTAARHTHSNKAVLDLITDAGSGLIVTDAERALWNSYAASSAEFIRDTVAAFIQDGTGISWTHNDVADTLTADVDPLTLTTDEVTEGAINLYYSNGRAREAISLTNNGTGLSNLTYDPLTGTFTHTPVTTAQVRATISAEYPIAYNATTGKITWIGGDWTSGGTSTAAQTEEVSQAAHGLTVLDAIRIDQGTGNFVKAQADTDVNAEVIGVVVEVADVNNFTYQYAGILPVSPNTFTEGMTYFLSVDTAGAIVEEPAYAIGEIRQFIGTGVEDGILLEIDQGDMIGSGELGELTTGTVESVVAGLGMDFITITTTGSVSLGTPSSITSASANTLTPNSHTHALDSTGVVAGTYTYATVTFDDKGRATSASSGTPPVLTLNSDNSITGTGTLADPFELVNDQVSPAPTSLYGTNGSGVRGWYTADFDKYNYWTVQANGETALNVTSAVGINLIGTGGVDIARSATDFTFKLDVEDISFEFRDIEAGTAQEYILDIGASYAYTIESAVLESDGTLNGVSVEINGVPVTGIDALAVSALATYTSTGNNSVTNNNQVTISTTTSYSGTPTLLRGKLRVRRA